MGVLGMIEDDEYLPEYGTLVVRDGEGRDRLPEAGGLLEELATSALSGELATAGDGWLHGTTGDPYQAVRLEAHEDEPAVELGEWEDVLVTPYRSRTGSARLGMLTGGVFGDELDLGRSGLFEVRVARRAAEEGVQGKVWLLQFWPVGTSAGHRWVKRSTAAEGTGDAGWRQVLGYQVMDVAHFAAGYGMPHPESWYDEPLPGDPVPASVCAQLGVPVPVTRRDAVSVLVAAGVLVPEEEGHRLVTRLPMAVERLELPEEQAKRLRESNVRARLARLAAEVTSIAAWGNPAPVDDLAERLLVEERLIPEVLAHAVSDRLIRHDTDGIRPLPRPSPTTSYVVMPKPGPRARTSGVAPEGLGTGGVGGTSIAIVQSLGGVQGVELPPGNPPRVGVVTASRDVLVWRGEEPVVLGRVPEQHVHHALETRDGVVVSTGEVAWLVRWDGEVVRLPVDLGFAPVRSADGRLLGGVQAHVGRHSWDQPHLLDLDTGEVTSLPRADGLTRRPLAVHGGALYFTEGTHYDATTHRWLPGHDPEPLGPCTWVVDPLSGTRSSGSPGRYTLHTPDGAQVPLTVEVPHHLAPGGTVYTLGNNPNTIAVHDPATNAPTRHRLPDDVRLGPAGPGGPVWESASTLVFPTQYPPRLVRWNAHTGLLDEYPLPHSVGHLPLPIAGILDRGEGQT
ncbi:DUF6042 family protein [Actinokineospora sp. PR83]|uniref:DUF6042 family protein n=1 Tax=Actinokineospora sp. PR83 TaxID=2884908 RepID=UPI001F190EF5|nr:DUF6042 family protein [Actinokineospora sp. PR83]MCG8916380.1 DUF6042 family protein [Actinokineospora sp. PR83]